MNNDALLYKYPTIPNGTTIHNWPDRAFISYKTSFNSPATTWSINESASNILQMFNGQNQIKDIINKLAYLYKTNEEDIQSKLMVFIRETEKRIPLDLNEIPTPINLRVTGNNNYITPMHAAIELTYQCNLKCKHCYIESGPNRNEIMEEKKAHELLNILSEWGVSVIEFTGGEPTIHSGFNELLTHAVELFDLVGIITNGTLITQETFEILSKNHIKIPVQIDLHGSNKEYVDWFTGRDGVFEREVNNIEKIAKTGALVRAVMVVTPQSLNQMRSTAELAKSLGATTFGLSPIVPQGRGSDPYLAFSEENFQEYLNTWNELKEEFGNFIFHLEESPFAMTTSPKHCGAGARTITITPNGDIKICQMSSAKLLSYGNIFYNKPQDIFGKRLAMQVASIIPPNIDICESCLNIPFCINCINRGLSMANKLGIEGCKWYREVAHDLLVASS